LNNLLEQPPATTNRRPCNFIGFPTIAAIADDPSYPESAQTVSRY